MQILYHLGIQDDDQCTVGYVLSILSLVNLQNKASDITLFFNLKWVHVIF